MQYFNEKMSLLGHFTYKSIPFLKLWQGDFWGKKNYKFTLHYKYQGNS